MKKYLLFMVLSSMAFLLSACTLPTNKPESKPITNSNKSVVEGGYIGSLYKGNYIYGGAMNLAWNSLNEDIIHEKVKLNSTDQDTLSTLSKLNNPTFTNKDLDEKSYYVKSGYGQQTVATINQESSNKFPQKSFSDLELKLAEKDIIAYAYLFKQVEYLNPFKEQDMLFYPPDEANPLQTNSPNTSLVKSDPFKKVKGFTAEDEKQKANIRVLKYWSDEKFIIALKLKDESDELFLSKGFDITSPDEVVNAINQYNSNQIQNELEINPNLNKNDIFSIPYLNLDYHRDYAEIVGKNLTNINFEKYIITQMFENIKFEMDYKGAKVENEAVVELTETAHMPIDPPQIRRFIFNKPFWVVMNRKGSQNPYFILGVKNSEFMTQIMGTDQ